MLRWLNQWLLNRKALRLLNSMSVVGKEMSDKDWDDVVSLYLDPRYKAYSKWLDNCIVYFQNDFFRNAYEKDEARARILLKTALLFIQSGVISKYSKTVEHKKLTPEEIENLPDGVPLE